MTVAPNMKYHQSVIDEEYIYLGEETSMDIPNGNSGLGIGFITSIGWISLKYQSVYKVSKSNNSLIIYVDGFYVNVILDNDIFDLVFITKQDQRQLKLKNLGI